MKRLFSCCCVLATVLISGPLLTVAATSRSHTLLLRVTSETPGQRVSFHGSVAAVGADEPYHSIKGRTPYELRITTTALHAVLHSDREGKRLKVEVLEAADDGMQRLSWVAGQVVVVDQDYDLPRSMVKGFGAPAGK